MASLKAEAMVRPAPGLRYAVRAWMLLGAAAVAALVLGLAAGTDGVSLRELVDAVAAASSPSGPGAIALSGAGAGTSAVAGSEASAIIWQLRWPRTMAAMCTGALLALSGALMQILLRNPLADPYVLGLSGGAAVGALLAMLAGAPMLAVGGGAGIGAFASVLLVFGLARRDLWTHPSVAAVDLSPRLLLTGVVLAAGWGAVITLILTFSPDAKLRGMLFWMMGDLNGADSYALSLAALVAALVAVFPHARDLNVLLRGEALAASLGVPVRRLTLLVFAVASLATAAAVVTAGAIGFVGLIVPHALRLVLGNDQRVLLPASALAGGTLLALADTLARTVAAPTQLPVGMLMALLGVPAFIWLMHGRAR